jgi:hypothetical protein
MVFLSNKKAEQQARLTIKRNHFASKKIKHNPMKKLSCKVNYFNHKINKKWQRSD